jgi:hypothetical protein
MMRKEKDEYYFLTKKLEEVQWAIDANAMT